MVYWVNKPAMVNLSLAADCRMRPKWGRSRRGKEPSKMTQSLAVRVTALAFAAVVSSAMFATALLNLPVPTLTCSA